MEVLMGIDLGTSYFKVGLFDREGSLMGLGRTAVPAAGPSPRAELGVEDFWSTLQTSFDEALTAAGARPDAIRSVGYSSQANSAICLGASGEPASPLVLWTDRSRDVPPEFAALWQRADFLDRTGLGIGPVAGFAAVKYHDWLRTGTAGRGAKLLTISDYLTHSLTGRYVGDAGTAALLGLEETPAGRWWSPALETIGAEEARLAELLPPGSEVGPCVGSGARRLGLADDCVLSVGSLDRHVAALGAGVGALADVSESTGTVLACLSLSEAWQPRAGCVAGPHVGGAGFFQLAFESDGAAVLEWYRREHAPAMSFAELSAAAAAVRPGCDGLCALPQANRRPGLEGFAGRTDAHGPGHFARAIMELLAEQLAGLLETLRPGAVPGRVLATGGGARSDLWLQIKADRLGTELVRTDCQEPACRGAAMLAGVGAGWFANLGAAQSAWVRAEKTFQPARL